MLIYYDYSIYKNWAYSTTADDLNAEILSVTEELMTSGKIIAPYSMYHITEFSVDNLQQSNPTVWYEILKLIKKYSFGHRFFEPDHIALNQLQAILKENPLADDWFKNWRLYFPNEPTEKVYKDEEENFWHIDDQIDPLLRVDEAVNLHPLMIEMTKTIKTEKSASFINKILRSYDGKGRNEILAKELGQPLSNSIFNNKRREVLEIVEEYCNKNGITEADVNDILNDTPIPFQHVFSALLAAIAAQKARFKGNDHYDIHHLAVALPAVDIIVSDNAWLERIENMGLADKYQTEVFTGKKKQQEKLLERLQALL